MKYFELFKNGLLKAFVTYEGGFSESLNTLISLEPIGAEQANNPHMKA